MNSNLLKEAMCLMLVGGAISTQYGNGSNSDNNSVSKTPFKNNQKCWLAIVFYACYK